MKKFLLFLSAALAIISCDSNCLNVEQLTSGSHSHTVSLNDVQILTTAMARGTAASTKATDFKQPEIIPIVDVLQDTIFYAVNFFPGWKLISSDKRTPIVLAENGEGEFSLNSLANGEDVWLECMAQDLRMVKESPGWRMPDAENGLYFEELWKSIRPAETKANEAYYGLYSSHTEQVVDREVGHLVSTHWGQGKPYNQLCPFKSDSITERVPAGCVAVAGAQMLYYLHGKIGLPTSAPTSGSCDGVHHNHSQIFSDFSSSAWSDMHLSESSSSDCNHEALLIGWVGANVQMDYGDNGSGATNAALARFINNLGIFCQKRSYDGNIAAQSLLDSIPVVAGAYGNLGSLNIPDYRDGHTFIIDGYKSFKNRTYRTYVKYNPVECLDTLDEGCYIYEPDLSDYYVTVSESSPWVGQIRMNWGWGNNTNDNTWYTMTDSWLTTLRDESGDLYEEHFNYNRDMIYYFQVL